MEKPILINITEEDVAAKDFHDMLASGDRKNFLEGFNTVTVKPYTHKILNPSKYAQLSKENESMIQVQLWAGENQVLRLWPSQIEVLDGIVVRMDQNKRFSAKLVRRERDYPYASLRYYFPLLESFWAKERIDRILDALGQELPFQEA